MRSLFLAGTALFLLVPFTAAKAQEAAQGPFPLDGFYGDIRYRYERVEQDSFTRHATASTVRTKFGYKTNPAYDLFAGIEMEHIGILGNDSYNSSVNGKVRYPVIADPEGAELNHLWLAYGGLPDTTIKLGRQPINIDNQRFVGTVGWRQNDQSFDAVSVINTTLPDTQLLYAYVGNVNRIFGDEHPLGDLDTRTHIAHLSYTPYEWLNIVGYGYWMDIDLAPTLSSKTFGLRLTGKTPINADWTFFYQAEAAEQSDHGNNPNDYDATYYHVAPGLKWKSLSGEIGFESLEGNGTASFQTPLATLHAFNGWADQFLTTPANGLEDLYGKIVYTASGFDNFVDGTKLVAAYHDFEAENNGTDYGDELDLEISHAIPVPDFLDSGSIALKYADYDADSFSTDTQKFWFTLQFKF